MFGREEDKAVLGPSLKFGVSTWVNTPCFSRTTDLLYQRMKGRSNPTSLPPCPIDILHDQCKGRYSRIVELFGTKVRYVVDEEGEETQHSDRPFFFLNTAIWYQIQFLTKYYIFQRQKYVGIKFLFYPLEIKNMTMWWKFEYSSVIQTGIIGIPILRDLGRDKAGQRGILKTKVPDFKSYMYRIGLILLNFVRIQSNQYCCSLRWLNNR